jgi:hypothetical protein
MKLQGRNLSIEMQGEEVTLHHSKPKLLDPFIVDKLNYKQGIGNGLHYIKINGRIKYVS